MGIVLDKSGNLYGVANLGGTNNTDAPDKLLSSRRVFLSRGGCDPILGCARRTGALHHGLRPVPLARACGPAAQGVSIRH
jgi:hypothetical protein